MPKHAYVQINAVANGFMVNVSRPNCDYTTSPTASCYVFGSMKALNRWLAQNLEQPAVQPVKSDAKR